MGGSCLKQSNHTGSLKQTLKLYGTIANSTSSYKHIGTYTMSDVMDSANGKLDPSVCGELGYLKNPKRKDFYEILQHSIQISKQNNIEYRYILAYGSLLGAMRDGDVIPYDSDIDVLVNHNYFSILKRLSVKTYTFWRRICCMQFLTYYMLSSWLSLLKMFFVYSE